MYVDRKQSGVFRKSGVCGVFGVGAVINLDMVGEILKQGGRKFYFYFILSVIIQDTPLGPHNLLNTPVCESDWQT